MLQPTTAPTPTPTREPTDREPADPRRWWPCRRCHELIDYLTVFGPICRRCAI